nr:unnamed protein product [Naegleria fowleri]
MINHSQNNNTSHSDASTPISRELSNHNNESTVISQHNAQSYTSWRVDHNNNNIVTEQLDIEYINYRTGVLVVFHGQLADLMEPSNPEGNNGNSSNIQANQNINNNASENSGHYFHRVNK